MKLILLMVALAVASCGKSEQDKVAEQLQKVYPLNADERQMAEVNAKQFFERQWVDADNQRGAFISCRPSDSNANGLVTCSGKVPVKGGGYKDVKMYCGYRKDLVGCSDEDTVK